MKRYRKLDLSGESDLVMTTDVAVWLQKKKRRSQFFFLALCDFGVCAARDGGFSLSRRFHLYRLTRFTLLETFFFLFVLLTGFDQQYVQTDFLINSIKCFMWILVLIKRRWHKYILEQGFEFFLLCRSMNLLIFWFYILTKNPIRHLLKFTTTYK